MSLVLHPYTPTQVYGPLVHGLVVIPNPVVALRVMPDTPTMIPYGDGSLADVDTHYTLTYRLCGTYYQWSMHVL